MCTDWWKGCLLFTVGTYWYIHIVNNKYVSDNIHIGKVQLFWEGYKNLRHPPYGFDVYLINVKTIRRRAQFFVAFSERLNFTYLERCSSKHSCLFCIFGWIYYKHTYLFIVHLYIFHEAFLYRKLVHINDNVIWFSVFLNQSLVVHTNTTWCIVSWTTDTRRLNL